MYLQPVSSSNIDSIGYENNTLYVRFHHGGTYAYYGVPQHIYEGLMNAASHGEYLAKYVKNNYKYSKIG